MKTLPLLILAATVAFVISPLLTEPFSGFKEDQLPIPQIDPPIQPAGYAFAIWGVIYGWLLASAAFGLIKRPNDQDWQRARAPLLVSLSVGAPWLAIANVSAIWATVTISIMAATAILSLVRAPEHDRWWFQAPVGIYAGWLTAASCVALGTTATGYGVLFGDVLWAVLGILIALVVALIVFNAKPAPEYLGTIVWALIGIVVANGTTEVAVSGIALAGIALLSALILRQVSRPRSSSGV